MTTLTQDIAGFVAHAQGLTVPPKALDTIRNGFIDTFATMMAGRNDPAVHVVRRHARAKSLGTRPGQASGADEGLDSAAAALIDGTAAHALDFDDVALSGHPSTVLVPAILAEGRRLESTGAQAIRAYLAGYETWAELVAREPDPYHSKGWHPTAVLGTMAATAAVASLNGLSATQCAEALGLAASMASGLVANFGTMTKPLHAGRAAANAIEAVQLVLLGMSAARDVLEHDRGYLAALSPGGRADRRSPADMLGQRLRILTQGLSIKRYPVCYAAHRAIDGTLSLAGSRGATPGRIESIEVQIGPAQDAMLRNRSARTGLEAKFSLEFVLACALIVRKVGLAELNDAFVARADVQALMGRVRRHIVHTQCPIEPVFALHDRVRIRLADGQALDTGDIRYARGNAQAPLSPDEIREKFMDCAAHGGFAGGAARLYDELLRLEQLDALPGLPPPDGDGLASPTP